ncbi:hypothetical protein SLA2020_378950 [Shorea laevis]
MEQVDLSICKSIWGSEDCDWIKKAATRRARGILCMWSKGVFTIDSSFEGEGFLGVKGAWGLKRTKVAIISLYSPCEFQDKLLWENLKNIIASIGRRICVMGDFNVVISKEDSVGRSDRLREIMEFNNFISDSTLIEMPLVGRKFT